MPPSGGRAVRLVVLENNQRFYYLEFIESSSTFDPALKEAVRMLSALAWASDETPGFHRPPPTRFDLGSDPYQALQKDDQ